MWHFTIRCLKNITIIFTFIQNDRLNEDIKVNFYNIFIYICHKRGSIQKFVSTHLLVILTLIKPFYRLFHIILDRVINLLLAFSASVAFLNIISAIFIKSYHETSHRGILWFFILKTSIDYSN